MIKALSIDGGGILGIVPATILAEVERRLCATQNKKVYLSDYVDYFVGTSTGAILSSLYVIPSLDKKTPVFSAQDALNCYLKFGSSVFKQSILAKLFPKSYSLFNPKYSAVYLEKILFDIFGCLTLKELLRPYIATAYETNLRETYFFSKGSALKDDSRNFYMRDVLRATSAAPTYFSPCRVSCVNDYLQKLKPKGDAKNYSFIDGGVFANNPALCAYCEIRAKHGLHSSEMLIISLGTGQRMTPYPYEEVEKWGAVGWARSIINILMDGGSQVSDYMLDLIFNQGNYLRFDPFFPEDLPLEMDNASSENITQLVKFSNSLLNTYTHTIDKIVTMLLRGK